MKKNIVIVGLCLAALFLLSRQCGLTEKYKLAKHDYNELVVITDADKKMSDARISELNESIGYANKVIVQKEMVIAEKSVLISRLSNQLDELQNSEPVQPELESQPLVINLRGQISKLSEMYSLSQQVVTLQAGEIEVLKGKCIDLVSTGDRWKVQYEKEHALRLSAEGLFKIAEHEIKVNKFWGKVKTVAIVTVAGGLAYSIFKHK